MFPVRDVYLPEVRALVGSAIVAQARRHLEGTTRVGIVEELAMAASVIDYVCAREPPGAILCFLPGWQEIEAVVSLLRSVRVLGRGRS